MNLELIKSKPFDFYIIRFTETGIQHIATDGHIMGVVDVPCSHDGLTDAYFGVSNETFQTFQLMQGMDILGDTIGGIQFSILHPDTVPNVNKTLSMQPTDKSELCIDTELLRKITDILTNEPYTYVKFLGDNMPVVFSGQGYALYLTTMG